MSPLNPRITSTRKTRMGPEADQADREFWTAMSAEERVELAWQLSVEQWQIAGKDTGVSGTCRSIARVIRR
jgi:hypothetical protein